MQDYFEKYRKISFYEQIRKNKIKSFLLIAFIVFIIILLSLVVSYVLSIDPWFFIIIASVFSLIYTLIAFHNGHKIALASVSAYEADKIRYKHLHNMLEGLAIAAGLPKPKLYIMPSDEINAFASGKNPENAVICVSEGCLKYLEKHELEGVLAHEMSHIANYDIRFMMLVVVMVGIVSIIANIFLRSLWFSNNNDNKNALFIVLGILFAILAPLFATLVQLAISRKREFMADANAVRLVRDNRGLIGALKKIKAYYSNNKSRFSNTAVSALFISDTTLSRLFSSHPPIDERIKVLEAM